MLKHAFIKHRTFSDEQLVLLFEKNFKKSDYFVTCLILFYSLASVMVISRWHNFFDWAVYLAAVSVISAFIGFYFFRGHRITRSLFSALLACFYALAVQQTQGLGEAHLLFIINAVVLCLYRDLLPSVIHASCSLALVSVASYLQFHSIPLGSRIVTMFSWGYQYPLAATIIYPIVSAIAFVALYCSYRFILNNNQKMIELYTLSKLVSKTANGQLSQKSTNYSHSKLVRQASDIFEKIEFTLTSLNTISQRLTQHSQQFGTVATTLGTTARDQKNELMNLTVSLDGMSDATKQVAKGIVDNNRNSKTNKQLIRESVQQSRTCQKNILQLSQHIRDSYKSVSKLEQGSRQIDDILNNIRGVSEQTSLLALNAAIESSRVGAEGKGFALVAEEVRTLSQKTNTALADIAGLVSGFHADTQVAINNIDLCSQVALATVNDSAAVQNNMASIARSNHIIQEGMENITYSVKKQARSYKEIKQRSDELVSTAKPIMDNVYNIQTYTQQLQLLSAQMSGILNQYELSAQ